MRFALNSRSLKRTVSTCALLPVLIASGCGGDATTKATDTTKAAAAEPAKGAVGTTKKKGSDKVSKVAEEDTSFHVRKAKQKAK